jgi:hypothetical protein
MKTLDWSVETLGLEAILLGFVIIYLNQSSERNMIDIPSCSERTNFKCINFALSLACAVILTVVLLILNSQAPKIFCP